MLIGVIIRAKSKRVFDHITGTWSVVGMGSGLPVQPVPKPHDLPERSYTPPLPTDEDIQEIALAAKDSEDDDDGTGERSSSARKNRGVESSVEFLDSGSLKRPATDSSEVIRPKKRHISSTSDSSVATSPFLTEEPNSPPEEIFVEASLDQESMLAELNRQIEEHKKELSEMQKTIGNEEEEPYSPSHGHSPPPPGGEQFKLDTSKISIPSNLQEILDNIRQKEVEIKQKEQEIKRRLSLTSDPIVMIYGKYQEFEKKKKIGDSITTASKADIDLRPLLQNKLNKDKKTDVDLRVLKKTDENKEKLGSKVDSCVKTDEDTDLRIRDPRLARAQTTAVVEKGKTLSKMSDEELLAKVSEMEDGDKISGQCHSETGAESLYQPAQPPFMQSGLAGGYLLQGGATMVPDGLACSVGPSQPPGMSGHMTYIGAMGPPQPVDMYGPPLGGRLQGSARHAGSHGPPDHTNSSGHSGTQGHSGYSGPPGPHGPQSHSGPHGSHGPQSHSGPHGPHGPQSHSGPHGPPSYASPHGLMRPRYSDSGWEGGKSYNSRDWGHHYSKSRDRDRDRDRERDWEREWHPRTGRDKGHSKFHHMGRKRYEGRISGRERSRDNFYHDKHDRDRDHPYEDHESGKDSPYPEIDY
ncbi:uncharacterized protein DDB_G0284459-like [Homarus americanus]|uniref:uncharacterized protein DDB_G0284459-like n=1 Tax=Homarus americanus TaxID=6706 RepID=UPI001C442B9A|nr:uncharacterized protein DDB_G0284459-like [Homarus americanus]